MYLEVKIERIYHISDVYEIWVRKKVLEGQKNVHYPIVLYVMDKILSKLFTGWMKVKVDT